MKCKHCGITLPAFNTQDHCIAGDPTIVGDEERTTACYKRENAQLKATIGRLDDSFSRYMTKTQRERKLEAEIAQLKADLEEECKDSNRFRWLIKRGIAWRGCYVDDWREGEWLYDDFGAREEIDNAMDIEETKPENDNEM